MFYSLIKLFFPSLCISCGILGDSLCFRCLYHIELSPHIRELDGLKVHAGLYYSEESEILKRLIHPFKYQHQGEVFRIFVPYMVKVLTLHEMNPHHLILVPVPLHPKRERERGYNQAALLAKWVAKCVGATVRPYLIRQKETQSQAQITEKASRAENLKDAFSLKDSLPKGGHFLLVDDIVTSGSTLLACAQILREAGAEKISALVLADREKKPSHPWN